jgi:hypothetical protein
MLSLPHGGPEGLLGHMGGNKETEEASPQEGPRIPKGTLLKEETSDTKRETSSIT